MRRREYISLFSGAMSGWPLAALAQQPERVRRIGVYFPGAADDTEYKARNAAFLQGAARIGLDRRPHRADRLSLGRGGWPTNFQKGGWIRPPPARVASI